MKYIIALLTLILISGKAFAQGAQTQEKKLEEPVYISRRIEADLIRSIGPIDKEKLRGKWKKVLVGSVGSSLGYGLRSGVKEGTEENVQTLTFAATETDWLPGTAGLQLSVIADGLPRNHVVHEKVVRVAPPRLKSSPIEVKLEGDRAKFSYTMVYDIEFDYERYVGNWLNNYETIRVFGEHEITVTLSCGLQHDNPNRMLCAQEVSQRFNDRNGNYYSNYDSVKNAVYGTLAAKAKLEAKLIGFERVQ